MTEEELRKESLRNAKNILNSLSSEITSIINNLESGKKKLADGGYITNGEILDEQKLRTIITDITHGNENINGIIKIINSII